MLVIDLTVQRLTQGNAFLELGVQNGSARCHLCGNVAIQPHLAPRQQAASSAEPTNTIDHVWIILPAEKCCDAKRLNREVIADVLFVETLS